MTDVINICAPGSLDPYDSYGLIAIELARHLTRMGTYVNLFALGHRELPTQDAELAAIVRQPVRPALGAIHLGYPTNYQRHDNPLTRIGPQVAVTMFESSRIPQSWLALLNQCDSVVTPSTFCTEVFRECGVIVPISTVPLGISDLFRPGQRTSDRPFTFLAFLDRGKRKGGSHAIQAFLQAFGDDPNVRLVLKQRRPKVEVTISNPNMELIQRDMTEEELYALYLQTDCLVNPNMGEGFGIIPRAYAATGGIALTTAWGGTADDLPRWGVPLPYSLVAADWQGNKYLQGQDLGMWALPDIEGVAATMRQVYEQASAYRVFARQAATRVRELYSWRRFAEEVYAVWKGIADGRTARLSATA